MPASGWKSGEQRFKEGELIARWNLGVFQMKKHGKKYRAALEKTEPARKYTLDDAVKKLKEIAFAKFDETVELTMWLGVDPRKADQLVRGTIVLPHGLGRSKSVLVIAQGDKIKEAEEAGADFVGGEDMVTKIKGGWLEFDAVIAPPDMMRLVAAPLTV